MIRKLAALILITGIARAAFDEAALDAWFAESPAERGTVPAAWSETPLDSKEAATVAAGRVWKSYREGAVKLGWDRQLAPFPPTLEEVVAMPADQRPKLAPSKLEAGGKTMPYVLLAKGKKPLPPRTRKAGRWPASSSAFTSTTACLIWKSR